MGNQGSNQTPAESRNGDRLEGWKEIAAYVRRDVRTVQRWEDKGFPVHRLILKRQGSVFAFRSEIDEWMRKHVDVDRVPAPAKIMLAVLPFENMSGDPQQEYFSDGLTDEMITELGRLRPERLCVIARTSVMIYKHDDKTAAQIGKELGVDYILEGSVSRSPGRVRIRAQLVETKDQTHLWADSYDRNLEDVLAIQSDVAKAVAEEIRLMLTPQQQERLAKPRAVNPDAYLAYLKGRHFWNRRYEGPSAVDTVSGDQQTALLPASAPGALVKSVHYFQDAIQKDPDFPLAYSGLADAYSGLGVNGLDALPPRVARPEAKQAAMKALELDENLAEAHVSLASVRLLYDWDFPGAEKEFKRAIELNDNYATAHLWYGQFLLACGRAEEAIAETRRALKLDPLSPVINSDLCWKLYMARQYDRAIEQCQKTIDLESGLFLAHYHLGMAYLEKGLYAQARAAFRTGKRLSAGSPLMLMALARADAMTGQTVRAQRVIRDLKQLSHQRYVPALYIAGIYASLDDRDQAFTWLQSAVEERSNQLVYLKTQPVFDNLRSDPRFNALLRSIGLLPSGQP